MQEASIPSSIASISSNITLPIQYIQASELQLGDLIGEGGFGAVYKAMWQGLPVAVKKLHLKTLSSATKKEFEQETQMMASCQFPYVVRLFGICLEASGSNALVMEYMAKGSLYEVLHDPDQNLPLAIRWNIATDIGRGINYLHCRGIIHRDIKSHNIFLDEKYKAKVGDFGLAKVKVETTLATKIESKNTAGSTRWKAPELYKPKSKHDMASDMYSYGIVMWEIASRKLPFEEENEETVKDWVKEGAREDIPDDCSAILGKLIEHCWDQDPSKRPTASDVVKELEVNIPKAEVVQEKSWHFDPAIKIPASAMKDDYAFLDAGPKDMTKVVSYYQHHPVPGMEIKSVKVLFNPHMNRQFETELRKLQNRNGKEAFKPRWSQENDSEWRAQVNAQFEEKAKPYVDPSYPDVKLLPFWHGTKPNLIPDICETGYANLAKTDSGYFGKGIYSAYEAEYSYRVYAKGALVLNWVAVYSAYPVINGDMDKLTGGANYQNYDAHFAPVVPNDPHNPKEVDYYPCRPNQKHIYTELVVFESARCLPRYLVELQPSLQKGLPLKPKTQMQILKEALQYAYQHYLSQKYDAPGGEDREYTHKGVTIYRPNHGLPHTLHCIFYAPLIAEAYNKMNLANKVSQEDVERIQIALVFHVAGRRNDMSSMDDKALYKDARDRSADAFELYVKSELANKFTEEQCQFYKEAIRELSGFGKDDPRKIILYLSHYLDLPRCLKKEICEGINRNYEDVLGREAINRLVEFVKQCLIKTGDRIIGERDYKGDVFIETSRNIDVCMNLLEQVTQEFKEKEKAEAEAKLKAEKEAKKKAKEELKAKIKADAVKKTQEEAEAKAKQEAEVKAKAELLAKVKAEEEKKAKEEAETKAKQEAEAKAKQEAEEKTKKEAEEKAKAELLAKMKAEEEKKAKEEVEIKAKQEAEAKVKQEVEEKAKTEVPVLLKWVVEGHLEEAEKLLQKNPQLALVQGTIKDLSDRIFENITAFQLAIWYLDDEMWEIILKYLDNSEAAKQLSILENDRKDIHKKYGKHFNFDPLVNAYETLIQNFNSWGKHRIEHWCRNIGGEQCKVPAWYIYAFCEVGDDVPWVKKNFMNRRVVRKSYVWADGKEHKLLERWKRDVVRRWQGGNPNNFVPVNEILGFSFAWQRCGYWRSADGMPLKEDEYLHLVSAHEAEYYQGPPTNDLVSTKAVIALKTEQLSKLQAKLHMVAKAKEETKPESELKLLSSINSGKVSQLLFSPPAAIASQPIQQQFSSTVSIDPAEVTALLKWVTEGNLEEAEKLLQKNPQLVLVQGTIKDLSDRTFDNITAFQLAVWYLDNEMWKIILKYLDKSEAVKQLHSLQNERKDIHEKYGKHFDFDSLLKAYDIYYEKPDSWTRDQRDQYWCNEIAGEQCQVPAWFVYAFCEEGQNVWRSRYFENKEFKRNYNESHLIEWWIQLKRSGNKVAWLREDLKNAKCINSVQPVSGGLKMFGREDRNVAHRLKSIKTEQLRKLQATLHGEDIILKQAIDVDPPEVTALFKCVVEGQLEEAEKLLQKNPKLALVQGTINDLSNRTFENITAFQYAVWALDDEMWEIILKYLDKNEAAKQLNVLENYREDITYHYGICFGFDSQIEEYQTYTNLNHNSWDAGARYSQWIKVGGKQRQWPAWLLYAFCEKGESSAWPSHNFTKEVKRQYHENYVVRWFGFDSHGLGHSFAFLRSKNKEAVEDRLGPQAKHAVTIYDHATSWKEEKAPVEDDMSRLVALKERQQERRINLKTSLQSTLNLAKQLSVEKKSLSQETLVTNQAISQQLSSTVDVDLYKGKPLNPINPGMVSQSLFSTPAVIANQSIQQQSSSAISVDPSDVSALLKSVTEGQLEAVKQLLQKNPKLALAQGTIKDLSDRTFENITAFQLAVWYLDDEMWEVILKYLDKSEATKQLNILENDRIDIHAKYGKHFNFGPLLAAYNSTSSSMLSADSGSAHEKCKQVGGAQYTVPAWYLYAFSAQGKWGRDVSKLMRRVLQMDERNQKMDYEAVPFESGLSVVGAWFRNLWPTRYSYTSRPRYNVAGFWNVGPDQQLGFLPLANQNPNALTWYCNNAFQDYGKECSFIKNRQEMKLSDLQANLKDLVPPVKTI